MACLTHLRVFFQAEKNTYVESNLKYGKHLYNAKRHINKGKHGHIAERIGA